MHKQFDENEREQHNLLDIIAKAGDSKALPMLLDKLTRLDTEAKELKKQIELSETDTTKKVEVKINAGLVRSFIEDFEQTFDDLPQDEKKLMIKKCISEIVIDKQNQTIKFAIRKVPAATQDIEKLYDKRKALIQEGMSAHGSGGTNYSALTRYARIKIKELLPKEGTPTSKQAQLLAA